MSCALGGKLLIAGPRVEEEVLDELGHLLYLLSEIVEYNPRAIWCQNSLLNFLIAEFLAGGPETVRARSGVSIPANKARALHR